MAFSHISFFPLLLLTSGFPSLSGHRVPCCLPLFTLRLAQGSISSGHSLGYCFHRFPASSSTVQTQMALTDKVYNGLSKCGLMTSSIQITLGGSLIKYLSWWIRNPGEWGLVICTLTGFLDSSVTSVLKGLPEVWYDIWASMSFLPSSVLRALWSDPRIPSLCSISVFNCRLLVLLGPFRKIISWEWLPALCNHKCNFPFTSHTTYISPKPHLFVGTNKAT